MTSLLCNSYNCLNSSSPQKLKFPGTPLLIKNITVMSKQQILKIIVSVLIAALTALGAAIGLQSCNVVRTISNKSEFYQRGDTSVLIQTKTTESYDARKNGY